jgi:hypothetical protein
LVQPKSALKTPQPPPPLILALQHWASLARGKNGWRGTHVDVPDGLADVVRAGPGADLGDVAANEGVPLVYFEVADGLGEEPGGDEVEEAGGDDEQELQRRVVTAPSGVRWMRRRSGHTHLYTR